MKICKKCKEAKSLALFPKNKNCKDGYELSCKVCKRSQQKEWEASNKDKCRAARQRWAENNPDRNPQAKRDHYLKNKEKYYTYASVYAKQNPDWKRERTAARRSALLNRIPSWANLEEIKKIYSRATELGLTVDHIIPLRGKYVSGLHVENNLQLLTLSENSIKHNKFDVDKFDVDEVFKSRELLETPTR